MAHNEFKKHEQTVQELQNRGFDPTFDVPTAEILGYDAAGNALRRIAVNSDGSLISDSKESTDLEGGGKVSVGTTAVEVTFTGTTQSIIITADKDNTGVLYIGKSDVTNAGANAIVYLEAGDWIELDYNDVTNGIYVVSDTASQYFWKGALL